MFQTVAYYLRVVAQRAPENIVKGSSPEALDATADLLRKLIYTTMDAAPARVTAAREEWAVVKRKILNMDATVDEAKRFGIGLLHIFGWFEVGRMLGARSLLQ
mmetsp:Transcript_851/g.2348  ORF Transcript_851/g.2348 Transcript_851/m.2348 type:complete len:103 (+) Transcript_851:81-389(+)